MAIIYYPSSSVVNTVLVNSGSYVRMTIGVYPNHIFFFDTQGNLTSSFIETSSSYSGTSSLSTTSSFSNIANSSSISNYAVYFGNSSTLNTITASTGTIPINLSYAEQILNFTASTNVTFSAVSSSTSGIVQDTCVYVNNSALSNVGVFFPSTWINIGGGWPTIITASKSGVNVLRSSNNTLLVGSFNPQL